MKSVGNQLAQNTLWRYGEQFSVMGIQMICTFIMARFLSPDDYGVLGIITAFTLICNIIIDSGFGQALVREREVSRLDYSTILYTNLAFSLIIYALLFVSAGLIANFYHNPALAPVFQLAFLGLPLNALGLVQMAKLQRELQFRKLCLIAFAASMISSVIAIYLAYIWRNVWALVWQLIMLFTLRAILLWTTAYFPLVFTFSKESFHKYFRFSKHLLLSGLIGSIFNNIYALLIGRFYGTTPLGYFTQADRLRNVTSVQTTTVIQNVTYPILSRIHNAGEDLHVPYRKIIWVSLLIVGTLMALLLGCAHDLFELLMGSKEWRMAGTFFILAGLSGILYPLHCINQNILLVVGESKTVLYLEIARRCIMVIILFVTLQFGVEVFVAGASIYSFCLLFLNLYYCGRPISYSLPDQLRDMLPILLRQLLVCVVSTGIGWLMHSCPIGLRLTTSLLGGILAAFLLFRKNPYLKMGWTLLQSLLAKFRR